MFDNKTLFSKFLNNHRQKFKELNKYNYLLNLIFYRNSLNSSNKIRPFQSISAAINIISNFNPNIILLFLYTFLQIYNILTLIFHLLNHLLLIHYFVIYLPL